MFDFAPWADILYACDGDWWKRYFDDVKKVFSGECWTYDYDASMQYSIRHINGDTSGKGLGKNGIIHTSGNGGYQAINLVYLLGAKRIILMGFDMQRTNQKSHCHGDHPGSLNRFSPYGSWAKNFIQLARDLHEEGVEVINATRETALNCFKRQPIEEALI